MRWSAFMAQGGTIRDYLDIRLAYDTSTAGDGNLGDTIPTLVDSMFNQIDESINGIRRVPGVDVRMTPTAAQTNWPVFVESGIGTIAQNQAGEGAALGGTQQREGQANEVNTTPYEFLGWCEITKTVLAKSAVDLMPAITEGLARTSARMTERAFAQGDGTTAGQPEGIFRAATGNNVQVPGSQSDGQGDHGADTGVAGGDYRFGYGR